jgi:hypothetical protein
MTPVRTTAVRRTARVNVIALALVATLAPLHASADDADGAGPDAARYGDGTLDLSESWGTAGACVELSDHTECFGSESELLAAHPEFAAAGAASPGAARSASRLLADCSSSLRLYDGTSYGGAVLFLTTRQVFLNLSAYGFDNRTSSYKVGACATNFYTGSNGGGSSFTGGASTQSPTMPAGWNNVVSSVYIG